MPETVTVARPRSLGKPEKHEPTRTVTLEPVRETKEEPVIRPGADRAGMEGQNSMRAPFESRQNISPNNGKPFSSATTETRPRNLFLSTLPYSSWGRLLPHIRHCLLFPGQTLQTAHQPMDRIYFPNSGLVSLIMSAQDGSQTEIGVAGCESMVGAMSIMGADKPFYTATVQIAGNACWLPVAALRDEFRWSETLQEQVFRHYQLLTIQAAQSALCNRLHSVEERLNRWLLTVRDRIGLNEIEITHSHIARMLGTRRSSVTLALGDLQEKGIIDMSRGHITLVDGDKMEQHTCDCYRNLRQEFEAISESQSR